MFCKIKKSLVEELYFLERLLARLVESQFFQRKKESQDQTHRLWVEPYRHIHTRGGAWCCTARADTILLGHLFVLLSSFVKFLSWQNG